MKYTTFSINLTFFLFFFINITTTDAQYLNKDVERIEQNRSLTNFDKIAVSHGIDVHLHQAKEFKVTIKAKEKVIDEVITEVKRNTLLIKIKNKHGKLFNRKGPIDVTIHLPNITEISASGGSDVYGKTDWNVEDLNINISGGSDVEMDNIIAETINCNSSGGSDIEISGTTEDLRINCSGGSDVEAKKLTAKECKINASGGSDINVYVTDNFTANASGASDITYKGNPKNVNVRSTGASDISN